MYKNKSKIYAVCKEMLELMNTDLYLITLAFYGAETLNAEDGYEKSLENKAAYLVNDKPVIEKCDNELKRLMDMEPENEVRIQGMFRDEIINTICYYKKFDFDLIQCWFENKPDIEEVLVDAFKKFDTIKNSETYPFDVLACQLIVSECVRGYFTKAMLGE